MPLIVILKSGQRIDLPGESYASLVAGSIMGTIKLFDNDGDDCFLAKSEIAFCKQISTAKHQAAVEAQKKAQEEQAKQRADAEAEVGTLALLESKTWRGRMRRLFGRKP